MAEPRAGTIVPRISPGKMYKGIALSREDFEKGETKLVKATQHRFVQICKKLHASFPIPGGKEQFSQKMREAIDFLGWDLKPEEFFAARNIVLLCSVAAALLLGFLAAFLLEPYLRETMSSQPTMIFFYLMTPLLLGAIFLTKKFIDYPFDAAKDEQIKALTFVPEIVGYMIMSMKLVPNLEKAVEFAVEHGRGKIAEDLKKVIWDTQLGIYNTLSEGLDAMAYRWGKFSDEFKRALMMIRASVLEDSESKRYALLDKTMSEMLDSIKNKMENYARSLSQPSIVLFYIGVLLPLILVIILPVGSAFANAPLARPEILILIYNIGIPIGTFIFARNIIKQRPPTYEPPVIPDDFPGLPPKNNIRLGKNFVNIFAVMALVLIAGVFVSFFFHQFGLLYLRSAEEEGVFVPVLPFLRPDQTVEDIIGRQSLDPNYFEKGGPFYLSIKAENPKLSEQELDGKFEAEKKVFFAKSGNDITPYNLIIGIMLTVCLVFSLFLYYSSIYKRQVQEEIMQMETEFKDSLYVIASRLGENKPVEDAILRARDFLPDTLISKKVFSQTVDNIFLLGMSLEPAVFDKNFGSLRHVPSKIIQSSMKIVVGSVQLGVNVAARTLVSLSLQLSNSEKVSKMLTILVADISQMMFSISIFIAPIVLGITTSLQKVVLVTLSNIMMQSSTQTSTDLSSSSIPGGLGSSMGGLTNLTSKFGALTGGDTTSLSSMVNPLQFLIIIAVYVVQLVIIMTYYTTRVEEDNPLVTKIRIAYYLPIATAIYFATVLVSNTLVSVFV